VGGKAENELRRTALVGLPGSGKTTVGRLLAKELGWTFFDCDSAFEAKAGASISDWVAEHGWPAFRARESMILAAALKRDKVVIATGGGVVEDEKNRAALAARATIVWLDAPLEVSQARLASSHERPLLADDPAARLAELAARRNPLYRQIADLTINVADRSPQTIAQRVVNLFRYSLEGGTRPL
jgi:shikimate kinase